MLTATGSFLDSVEKWVKALRADDFAAAKQHSEFCRKTGELIAVHPDFIRCFRQHCGEDVEPRQALDYICQFFTCATEGRAAALKKQDAGHRH